MTFHDGCSGDEVHTLLNGSLEDSLCVRGIDLAPVGTAELPGTKANLGDCGVGVAQCARVHGC